MFMDRGWSITRVKDVEGDTPRPTSLGLTAQMQVGLRLGNPKVRGFCCLLLEESTSSRSTGNTGSVYQRLLFPLWGFPGGSVRKEESFRLCGRRRGWDVSREQH